MLQSAIGRSVQAGIQAIPYIVCECIRTAECRVPRYTIAHPRAFNDIIIICSIMCSFSSPLINRVAIVLRSLASPHCACALHCANVICRVGKNGNGQSMLGRAEIWAQTCGTAPNSKPIQGSALVNGQSGNSGSAWSERLLARPACFALFQPTLCMSMILPRLARYAGTLTLTHLCSCCSVHAHLVPVRAASRFIAARGNYFPLGYPRHVAGECACAWFWETSCTLSVMHMCSPSLRFNASRLALWQLAR